MKFLIKIISNLSSTAIDDTEKKTRKIKCRVRVEASGFLHQYPEINEILV